MKTLCIAILLLLPLRAFATEITDLYVDESAQTLNIIGHFGDQQGTVTVDSVTLPILFWSDTMISCHIDSDGRGSCGPVVVTDAAGVASTAVLLTMQRLIMKLNYTSWGGPLSLGESIIWKLSFRLYWPSLYASLIPDRSSTCSYRYAESLAAYDGTDGHNREKAGSGPIPWGNPAIDTGSGFWPSGTLANRHQIDISAGGVLMRNGLTVTTRFWDTIKSRTYEDFTLQTFYDLPRVTIDFDSSFRVLAGSKLITALPDQKHLETLSWQQDTTLFAPPYKNASVTTKFEGESESTLTDLLSSTRTQCSVYDIFGRLVQSAHDGLPSHLPHGAYFVRMESKTVTKVFRVLVN